MVSNLSAFFSRLNVILEDQNSSALIDLLKLGSSDDAFRSELVVSFKLHFFVLSETTTLFLFNSPEGCMSGLMEFI